MLTFLSWLHPWRDLVDCGELSAGQVLTSAVHVLTSAVHVLTCAVRVFKNVCGEFGSLKEIVAC